MSKAEEIKKNIENAGLKCWQVADVIGVSSYTLSVWFRHLDQRPDHVEQIETALRKLNA